MEKFKIIYVFSICFLALLTSVKAQVVDNSDIDRFWKAYDLIRKTEDVKEQTAILKKEFITPGSKGLKAIMDKKSYTLESYIQAINNYPKFWNSVRANTLKTGSYALEIEENIKSLKVLYPDLKPAQVFFTIGVLRTGGTAHKGHVLIGAELAMADSSVVTEEIEPERLRQNLCNHFNCNPINDVALLNVHEYIHTQQGDYGTDLLSMCIFEGVAEFVSVLAAKKKSAVPALSYGEANAEKIKQRFQKEMFSPNWNDWLYNDKENEFEVRDLGYYVGYAICEGYYNTASDKKLAIKEMIELDCKNKKAVRKFVEKSEYLTEDFDILKTKYAEHQPKVKGIKELHCNQDLVDPNTTEITIQFSKSMNPRFRNFKFGPKGRDKVLPINSFDWNEDFTEARLGIELSSDKQYQIVLSSEFRDLDGRCIDNFLIDLKTK